MLSREATNGFIRASMSYLVNACGPAGQFLYRINLDPSIRVVPKYNILRHAGAMYAIGVYLEQASSMEAEEALIRAAGFLHEQIAEPPGWHDTLAVWSRPEIEGRPGEVLEAKLGGTGLGLVGLLLAERIAPGLTPIDACRALGRFLLRMQRQDGSFVSLYVPAAGGPCSDWVSLYYPGEAALGLLCLYEHDPDPAWLAAGTRALLYLAQIRKGQASVEPDHWALLATAKWLDMAGHTPREEDREAILTHAEQVARSMMARVPKWPDGSFYHGCVVSDGRTCPTATQMEGLIAAIGCLSARPSEVRRQIEEHVEAGLGYLARCMISHGPALGGMPRAPFRLPLVCPEAIGQFNQRATEIRIDYVQHAVCAFLAWRQRTMVVRRTAA